MMKRSAFDVTVGGTNISAAIRPILISMTITDNVGTHSDTATLELDDTGGRIVLPKPGDDCVIMLGWEGGGIREVFRGFVDETTSAGSKSGGRTLSIAAKGVNTLGKAKEGQTRHFDDKSVQDVLTEAGKEAGITQVEVDPDLASTMLPYVEMRAESFMHLGERLAHMLGGSFRITGDKATLSKRAGDYAPSVQAAFGVNLISWNITPATSKPRYKKARAKTYDRKAAKEVVVEEDVGLDDPGAEATITRKDLLADPEEAKAVTKGDAATSREEAAAGDVVIDGSADAVPGGKCVLTGARPGIDGTYQITSLTHDVSGSGGWTTSLQLGHPQGGAGTDSRA